MTMTYINGIYRLDAQSRDNKELIKELTLAIKMLAEDVALMYGSDEQGVIDDIIADIKENRKRIANEANRLEQRM